MEKNPRIINLEDSNLGNQLGKFGGRPDVCGDCGSLDPAWAIVNRGILVCDECCSVHRSLGRHVSQVKSFKKSTWIISLLATVTALNNAGVNSLWEHLLSESKSKRKPCPKDPVHPTKAEFIRNKHKDLQFVLKNTATPDELSQELHASVRSSNLETSLRLLVHGADPNYLFQEKGSRPLHVAAKLGQLYQIELLLAYGADPCLVDLNNNTPAQYARVAGHRDCQLRLIEACYEVTDRLLYFISKTRLDHMNCSQHFVVPEARDCIVRPQHSSMYASSKLKLLSNRQFEMLAMDVYDEVDRREIESIWQLSGASLEHGSVPFLPVNSVFSSMRNQGRQKLGTLNPREFTALVLDILTDAQRRQLPPSEHINGRLKNDEDPLYDSVASDEDYATAEQLAVMVAQNARGEPLSISDVGGAPAGNACCSGDTDASTCAASSSLDQLKEQLALSRGQISQLTLQIRRLNNKMDEVTSENRDLKLALKGGNGSPKSSSTTVAVGVRGGSLGEADLPLSPNRRTHFESPRRPVSMYETSHGGGAIVMPTREEVNCRCEQVTKRIQALWSSVRPHTTYTPLADSISAAVQHLTSIFPQKPPDEAVKAALCQLNTSVMKLQAECATLENTSELVRGSAFNMASAIKSLITFYHGEKST